MPDNTPMVGLSRSPAGSVVAIMDSPQWVPTTTLPSGLVGCLVVDVGQGAFTRASAITYTPGNSEVSEWATREFEVVNRLAGPTGGGSVRPAMPIAYSVAYSDLYDQ